ncbi:MAG TPA: PilZ domain-containing protein [Candidatus Sulfotelmatobacter sp.]|nr:PilZ domain-containing protein [Candidatus Sulfotelmatobacter sp.]
MSAQPGKAFTSSPGRRLRRYPRYRSSFPVLVTLLAADRYQSLEAHCKDLSDAGIGVLLAAELASGEVVSLSFSLPGSSETWEIRSVLRHRRGYHYGFEFLSLSRDQGKVLKQHIHGLERADFDCS